MTHHYRHRSNGRSIDADRVSLIRAGAASANDSLPPVDLTYYYEVAPGSIIADHARAHRYGTAGLSSQRHASSHYREPRIHYDARTWTKEKGNRGNDRRHGILVVIATSLFAMSVIAGTVLFAHYILSCYGVY